MLDSDYTVFPSLHGTPFLNGTRFVDSTPLVDGSPFNGVLTQLNRVNREGGVQGTAFIIATMQGPLIGGMMESFKRLDMNLHSWRQLEQLTLATVTCT